MNTIDILINQLFKRDVLVTISVLRGVRKTKKTKKFNVEPFGVSQLTERTRLMYFFPKVLVYEDLFKIKKV